jgi:hypothetical protein
MPALRLVPGPRPIADDGSRLSPVGEVRRENLVAAAAADARWVLAVRTATLLEGGRAAILRPERRERLVGMATRLGLRTFDAALVIAIVQDSARSGRPALGRETENRLALVRAAEPASPSAMGWLLGAATAIGAAMFLALRAWILRG